MDDPLFLLSGVGILAAGLFLGLLIMRLRLGPELTQLRNRMQDQTRREEELGSAIQRLQSENKVLAGFLVTLPDMARRLNSQIDGRSIVPLLANSLQQIFEPAQILIFTMNAEDKQLSLAFKKGISESVATGLRVVPGDSGIVGWAAAHQITMDREDFNSQATGGRRAHDRALDDHVSIDLVAPMTYEGECLGVLCVGGISKRPADNKRLIKMVADLGSLAYHNYKTYIRLQGMANSDVLTKMYTKRFLLERLGSEIHGAELKNQPLSVFIFDLDHFKKYNDTHGHLAGDELLRTLGRIVRQEVREGDIAARYGGEEFVIVLPGTRKEQALGVAEKIRKVIEKHAFPNAETQPLGKITISGGVASLGSDGKTTNDLLRAADQALYLAKEQGRNRVVAYKIRYLSDEEEEIPA